MENDTVLEMRIEISPGNTKLLKVTEEDEPRDVAKKFCQQNGLDRQIWDALTQEIEAQLEQIVKDDVYEVLFPEKQMITTMGPENIQKYRSKSQTKHAMRMIDFSAETESMSSEPYEFNDFRSLNSSGTSAPRKRFIPEQYIGQVTSLKSTHQRIMYKKEALKDIFNKLSDRKQYLSSLTMRVDNLTQQQIQILQPVISEIAKSYKCYKFNEFYRLASQTQNFIQKNIRNIAQNSQQIHKPKQSGKPPRRLNATFSRAQQSSVNSTPQSRIYNQNMILKTLRDRKIEKARQDFSQEEMRECTFRPRVGRRNHSAASHQNQYFY